jgi:hypothetical protein
VTERKVSKLQIAQEYLDAAIEFFLAGTNFFCAIHLAAAAEELFGAHLPKSQRVSTAAWKANRALKWETDETGPIPTKADALRSVNKWKNEVKHMRNRARRTVAIDPPFIAEHHIEHALINFYKLKLQKSAALWKFEDHRNRKVSRLAERGSRIHSTPP